MIKKRFNLSIAILVFILFFAFDAIAGDRDSDGLDDSVETNTGIYIDQSDTGTKPYAVDTDGDGVWDNLEVSSGSNPVDAGITPSAWKNGLDMRITNDPASSMYSSVVWTGSEYGLAWQDGRDGNYEIYFARVDVNGNKMGPDIRITTDGADSKYPSLVWSGTEYGLSWQDNRDGNYEIYFARLNGVGNKIGTGHRITSNIASSEYPSLVWTGTEYGLTWEEDRYTNYEIFFARIAPTGNKIFGDLMVSPDNGKRSGKPSLVWTGSEYGIAWGSYGVSGVSTGTVFARIDMSGLIIVGSRVTITSLVGWGPPTLIWTGSEFGVAGISDTWGNIFFSLLDASGNKLADHMFVSNTFGQPDKPSLVWTGAGFGLSWRDLRDDLDGVCDLFSGTLDCNYEIYFALLDTTGNKIGADLRVTDDAAFSGSPSLVWSGTRLGLSWYDSRNGGLEIYFARIEPDRDGDGLSYGTELTLGTDPNDWDSDNDQFDDGAEDSFGTDPLASDTDGDGMPDGWEYDNGLDLFTNDSSLDPDSDSLTNMEEYNAGTNPNNSDTDGDGSDDQEELGNGTDPLNADTDLDGLSDKVETNTGIYVGPLDTGTDPLNPDSDGDGALDGSEVLSGAHPLDPRVTPSHFKIGADERITNEPADSLSPSLVWADTGYGVSWQENRDGNYETYFARIDQSGTKIGSDVKVTEALGDSNSPSMVWTGTEYGVVWWRNNYTFETLYFDRLDASGNKIGTDVRLSLDINATRYPSMAWSGTHYGISWRDSRGILFTRLDESGNKLGSELKISEVDIVVRYPSMVWHGYGYGVAWEDLRDRSEIYFSKITAGGSKDSPDMRITFKGTSKAPSLAWTGSEYGVSWQDSRFGNYEIYFARIDASGNKIGDDIRVTESLGASTKPSLIWTGSEYAVSWQEDIGGYNAIYFARIDANGNKIVTEIEISGGIEPSLVWTGSEYGVSWEDSRDGNPEIYFARIAIDSDGDGLDNATEISLGTTINNWDSDEDGIPDGWEYYNGFDPLADDAASDTDSDGLTNLGEYNAGTDPNIFDTDLGGRGDGDEVDLGLNPLLWTDDNTLPIADAGVDFYSVLNDTVYLDGLGSSDAESDPIIYSWTQLAGPAAMIISNPASAMPSFDATWSGSYTFMLEVADWQGGGNADTVIVITSGDADSDGLSDIQEALLGTDPLNPDTDDDNVTDFHEYMGGSDPNEWEPTCGPSLFCYGDQDGDGVTTLVDFNAARNAALLKAVDYSQVHPTNGEGLDLDASSSVDLVDVNIMRDWVLLKSNANAGPGIPSTISILSPAMDSSVPLGGTVQVVVEVRGSGGALRPGVGVVFEVISGNATLIGGRGDAATKIDPDTGANYPAGSRWAVTGDIATGSNASIIVRRDSAGLLRIRARVPKSPLKQMPDTISTILTLN